MAPVKSYRARRVRWESKRPRAVSTHTSLSWVGPLGNRQSIFLGFFGLIDFVLTFYFSSV